jgi:NTP pyrophosphatase (non-canonical NTP hydrolase)
MDTEQAAIERTIALLDAEAKPDPIDPERYCLGLLAGEMGEAAAVIGNALRFGLVTPQNSQETAAQELASELGDVLAAIDFAIMHGLVDVAEVMEQRMAKRRRLTSDKSRDNLGRRLAPALPEGGLYVLPQSTAAAMQGDQVRR